MNESISAASHAVQEKDFDGRLKILLAEDLEMNRTFFIKFLERRGLGCDVAVNGEEAVRVCDEKNYDIVFMDCQMPVMDGYEATRKIRASEGEKRHTVIIAMTAYAMKGDRDRCLEAGMDDYLSKPFKFEELMGMLQKYGRYVNNGENKVADTDYFSKTVAVFMEESGFDRETSVELFDGFFEHAQSLIYDIEENINNNNFENAGLLLHQLKGASGNMRVKDISKLALEAEEILGTSDNEKLKSILEGIKKTLGALMKKGS